MSNARSQPVPDFSQIQKGLEWFNAVTQIPGRGERPEPADDDE
jgi:hypothetical protein